MAKTRKKKIRNYDTAAAFFVNSSRSPETRQQQQTQQAQTSDLRSAYEWEGKASSEKQISGILGRFCFLLGEHVRTGARGALGDDRREEAAAAA